MSTRPASFLAKKQWRSHRLTRIFLTRPLLRAAIFAAPLFLLLPFIGIVFASLSRSGALSFPPSDWTLHWYGAIDPSYYTALLYSVRLSAATTALATVCGVPIAVAIARQRLPGHQVLAALCLAPLAVPTLVIAVAGFKFFMQVSDWVNVGLNGTSTAIVLLQSVFTLPLVVRAVVASFARYDDVLDEAAQSLGAQPHQVFRRITMPLIAPGILAGMLFAFVLSFDDVVVAWFMGDPATPTLPVKLFNAMEVDFDNATTALSTLIVGAWIVLAWLLHRFFRLDRWMHRR